VPNSDFIKKASALGVVASDKKIIQDMSNIIVRGSARIVIDPLWNASRRHVYPTDVN